MEIEDLLRDLIAIPSVNPMGREMDGSLLFEAGMSDYLQGFFEKQQIDFERIEVVPGRANVLARVEGRAGLPTMLWDAHQDTVPVDEMTIPPFEARVHDGRMYGRGACDVKGGMVAMLTALVLLAKEAEGDHPTVVMSCTCDEEFGQLGARHLVGQTGIVPDDSLAGGTADAFRPRSPSRLLPLPPDFAVVAEPTELDVAIAHRGATRWKLQTHGRSAHSSDPAQGHNAVYDMAKVVTLLEQYALELSATTPDPLCGPRTLSVGRILGGESVNIVPACCEIEIDRRTLPGEDAAVVVQHVQQYLEARRGANVHITMLPPWSISHPLEPCTTNRAVADRLVSASNGRSQIIGVPFGTHAARYSRAEIPSVVFGPGSIHQAHTKDEWIELDQVQQARDFLFQLATNWC